MTPALLLTILFIADDVTMPTVAIELREHKGLRTATIVVLGDGPPISAVLRDTNGRDVPAGASLVPPAGVSLAPAVDGVIVSFDDIGEWQPLPPPNPKAKATTPSTKGWPWPPPNVRVASPKGLRLFVPITVDGVPTPASLHGTTVRALGTAISWQSTHNAVGFSVAGLDVDASPVRLIAPPNSEGTLCAPPTQMLQRLTNTSLTSALCLDGGLTVGLLTGTRFGDTAGKDRPARGVVMLRR